MAFLYVYSPDDFVGGLPDEAGAVADGTPVFTLTLKAGATPTVIEVTDDDTVFDEVDGTQTLTNTVTIDGNTITAGTSINTAYDLINSTSGHKVTSFHFGGNGYQQGAVDGIVSTEILHPGTSYTFDQERTSHTQNNQYDDYVACFTAGTLIETKYGPVAIEYLEAGDLITTLDRGNQKIRWIIKRTVLATGDFAPVVLPRGAIGNTRDLILSPQHRVLLTDAKAEVLFECNEVFVSAKYLAEAGLGYQKSGGMVTYFHLISDQHEVIFSEGVPTESFLPSDLAYLPEKSRSEFETLFPELTLRALQSNQTARYCVKNYEAAVLLTS